MKIAIVNINIEIPCPNAKTDEEAEIVAEEYELPHGYVEDSFEIVKIIEENQLIIDYNKTMEEEKEEPKTKKCKKCGEEKELNEQGYCAYCSYATQDGQFE